MIVEPFPPDRFKVSGHCGACGHSADLPGWCNAISGEELRRRLRCSKCGAKAASITIVYTGAGEFHYGTWPRESDAG